MESEGILVEVAATTGIAASLYRNGRTVYSLLGLGVEEKDASKQHGKISRYGPQSQRAALLRKVKLCIIDESSMMQLILFEHVDAVLKDMRCLEQARDGIGLRELPSFVGMNIVLAGDYLQLLPVVRAKRTIRNDDGSVYVVPVQLLDELPWRSQLWSQVKVLRLTQQIRQADDTAFADILMQAGKGVVKKWERSGRTNGTVSVVLVTTKHTQHTQQAVSVRVLSDLVSRRWPRFAPVGGL